MADYRLVKHVSCSETIYKSLSTHDEDTLYFLEDVHKLYKGDVIIGNVGGGNLEYTTDTPDPSEMEDGVTYITVNEDGQVIVYQKDEETGEVEVVASTMSKEEIDELVKELVAEYAADGECFKDVEATTAEDGTTTLTFTQVDGDTKSVDIENNLCVWTYVDDSSKIAYTYEDVLDAMADPDVSLVTLASDIECTEPQGFSVTDGSEKTVDLNGHNVTGMCDYTDGTSEAFIAADGTLTIEGDGNVSGGSGSANNIAACADEDGHLIIKGGNYTVGKDADNATNSSVYALHGGSIEIYDGHFDNDSSDNVGPTKYALNIQNNSGSTITCYGGEYVDQNPADGDDKDTTTGSTFLAEGYKVEEREEDEHTIYTVVKDE